MQTPVTLLIIGGYGATGRQAARHLLKMLPQASVVLAGPALHKATAAARRLGDRARGVGLDATSHAAVSAAVSGADIVLLTTETGSETVARACLAHRRPLITIAADAAVLRMFERVADAARVAGVALVTEVGLAPGLMNLMARQIPARARRGASVDLVLQLGLTGDHGPEAIDWTLAQARIAGRALPLTPPLRDVGGSVIPMGFVNCDKLAAELGAAQIRAFLAVQPPWATRWLPRIAPLLLAWPRLRTATERGIETLAPVFGADHATVALVVSARLGDQIETLRLTGKSQSSITGRIAAGAVACIAADDGHHAGLISMADLLEFDRLIADLQLIGCTFERQRAAAEAAPRNHGVS